jgi:Putative zinc-finger
MNHPHDLLADLIDGTLDADRRAAVDAHLASCAACRADVAAAAAGRASARTLHDVPPPADLARRVLGAAGGRGDAGARRAPRWSRWAGVAAAAALAAVVAISLPDLGPTGSGDRAATESGVGAGPEATGGAATGSVPLERSGEDLRAGDLERLASRTKVAALAAPEADAGTDGTADASEAAACVARAFEGQPRGRLVRLIRARFQGRDAYVAVTLEGAGGGGDPDLAAVWAVSAGDCEILSYAQARL